MNPHREYTDSERWRISQICDAFQNDPNRLYLNRIKGVLCARLSTRWTAHVNDNRTDWLNAEVSYPDELGNNAELNRQIAYIDKELDLIKAKYEKKMSYISPNLNGNHL